jgi:DNA-binding NarL/FixJ family response regulator
LRTLLEKQGDMEFVGEAKTGAEAVQLAHTLNPDVVIMDISMPGLSGIEASRLILAQNKKIKIIGLSMHSDRKFILGMLETGACGYLLKDCAFDELAEAIRQVRYNKIYLSPGISDTLIRKFVDGRTRPDEQVLPILSNRERQILRLLAEGKKTSHIAVQLNISPKTVEAHKRNLKIKLEMNNLSELVRFAIREGLILPEK